MKKTSAQIRAEIRELGTELKRLQGESHSKTSRPFSARPARIREIEWRIKTLITKL
jgi:hypothetical protein